MFFPVILKATIKTLLFSGIETKADANVADFSVQKSWKNCLRIQIQAFYKCSAWFHVFFDRIDLGPANIKRLGLYYASLVNTATAVRSYPEFALQKMQ